MRNITANMIFRIMRKKRTEISKIPCKSTIRMNNSSTKILFYCLVCVILVINTSLSAVGVSTYELAVSGRTCKISDSSQSLECEYRIGSLWFTISGIGRPDTGVTFMNSSFDDDFYASFGLMHGCVTIKPGHKVGNQEVLGAGSLLDYAFVSPVNGNVYETWQECQDAR